MRFNVKHNFAVYQPTWTRTYSDKFGQDNEGFEVEAENMEQVKNKLKQEHNLNPFYLVITPIYQASRRV